MTIEAAESSVKQKPRRKLAYARPQEERPWVSANVVADYMGVCGQTVRKWIKMGKLKGEQIGKSYKIPLAAFDELKEKFPRPEGSTTEE